MTWTVTVTSEQLYVNRAPTYRIVAVSPDRRRIIHRDRLSAAQVESFDPEQEWRAPIINLRRTTADDRR